MNKPIFEIVQELNGRVGPDWSEDDKAEFARLIVEDCVQVCLKQRNPSNLNYKPSESFALALKQHFGIE